MSEHTPGPWFVPDPDATAFGRLQVWTDDEHNTVICDISGAKSNPESQADARLIAAAPDLLEACKQMYPLLVDEDKPVAEYDIAAKWLAAIAKAEGK